MKKRRATLTVADDTLSSEQRPPGSCPAQSAKMKPYWRFPPLLLRAEDLA